MIAYFPINKNVKSFVQQTLRILVTNIVKNIAQVLLQPRKPSRQVLFYYIRVQENQFKYARHWIQQWLIHLRHPYVNYSLALISLTSLLLEILFISFQKFLKFPVPSYRFSLFLITVDNSSYSNKPNSFTEFQNNGTENNNDVLASLMWL